MITLYTANTGNGHRVSIMLEEVSLPYKSTTIDFGKGEHLGSALKAVNPMGQIPAIVDTKGPDGHSVTLGESTAILRYLARKSGLLLPTTPRAEIEADRWAAITGGGLQAAPTTIFFSRLLGEEAHAPIIGKQFEVIGRYLRMMDDHLRANAYLAGDTYCYVDILGFTIANSTLKTFGILLDEYPAIARWKEGIAERSAVQRGLGISSLGSDS